MVRTAILSVAAACTLFALIGCNNRAEVDALQPAQAAELKPMQQSWRGVLPCADCEGIETSLFLEKDGTWVMNERYQGVREEPSSFASYGTWARTADKLVLTDSNGEKSYYRAKGNELEMLDREGNPVASQQLYACACYRQPAGNANAAAWYVCIQGRCGDLYRLRDRKTAAGRQ